MVYWTGADEKMGLPSKIGVSRSHSLAKRRLECTGEDGGGLDDGQMMGEEEKLVRLLARVCRQIVGHRHLGSSSTTK